MRLITAVPHSREDHPAHSSPFRTVEGRALCAKYISFPRVGEASAQCSSSFLRLGETSAQSGAEQY